MKFLASALLMLTAAPAVAAPGDCAGRLCNIEALTPFFDRLNQTGGNDVEPIRIIQIGDSHTAGDVITNAWRSRLQARYGFGGRGALAPGRPYPGVLTFGVTQSMTAGWAINSAFGKARTPQGAPVGIAGFSVTASIAGERLGVTADSTDQNFDRVTVCGARRPDGGSAIIEIGGLTAALELKGGEPGAVCTTLDAASPVSSASLVTQGDGAVTITSFATFVRGGGVQFSNFGIVGSQLSHLARENDRIVADELAEYRPDLVVLAFGTNEGFSSITPDRFEEDLRAQVMRLRNLMGRKVPMLLLGAPDANTRSQALANNYGTAAPCPGTGPSQWYSPTLLAAIRERQGKVARDMGLAYWDWSAAMGGVCAANRWNAANPPLVGGDHVHYTRLGGERIGAMLFDDIEAAAAALAR
ncbi:GDSL-type esterase/lipase family protein [Novosphingobium sp.]|uniref:GDSL-type esterase/lipase family protein n=1 Tax=Novosphingobium sp. TaxID=1874826 RepID=UPI002FE0DF0C